jgi:hypothetical protein
VNPKPHHVLVVVITTAGTFPAQGYDEVPEHQPVKVELAHAATALHLTNTAGWIATVGGQPINTEQSYLDNHLQSPVDIQWGPPEGGGGCLQ